MTHSEEANHKTPKVVNRPSIIDPSMFEYLYSEHEFDQAHDRVWHSEVLHECWNWLAGAPNHAIDRIESGYRWRPGCTSDLQFGKLISTAERGEGTHLLR